MMTTEKWYALYTNPRAEKKVAAKLESKGYTVYLPLQTTLKQWSDRKKKVQEPLFKSYLFIYTNLELHHIDILQTAGIMKFVRIGKEVVSLRQQQIDTIKLLLANETDIELTNTSYETGDEVEIVAGPLRGVFGHILHPKGNRNFALHIEQLGASLLLNVPVNYLKKR